MENHPHHEATTCLWGIDQALSGRGKLRLRWHLILKLDNSAFACVWSGFLGQDSAAQSVVRADSWDTPASLIN